MENRNRKVIRMITKVLKRKDELMSGDKILIGNTRNKIIIAIKILK